MPASRFFALCFVALVIALATVGILWTRRAPQVPEGAGPVVSKGAGAEESPGGTSGGTRVDPGQGPADLPDGTPNVQNLTPRQKAQAATLSRMRKIGRSWLEGFAAQAGMTDGQKDEVWSVVEEFAKAYEALRWRRDVEEDVETTVERLYESAERKIEERLGAGQKGLFRGLPRDWGYGKLDPGPIPEK